MSTWIRMRAGLLTNPRVVRMAKLLMADPDFMAWMCPGEACDGVTSRDESVTRQRHQVVTRVTIGGLLATWAAINDVAGSDGVVRHVTSRDIDESAGIPGFGTALMAVGWLEELPGEEGIRFVNFEEHNSPQKERALTKGGEKSPGAERQRRYRERKSQADAGDGPRDGDGDKGSDVTVTSRDALREEREEREELSLSSPAQQAASPPAKLPACQSAEIIKLYHDVLPDLPRVRLETKARTKALQSTWTWLLTRPHPETKKPRATNAAEALDWLRRYFEKASANDFLMGRTPRNGDHANWKCDLDFLLTERGMRHVIEKTN